MTGLDDSNREKTAPPPFDFQKAVAEARADYPRQTKNITFIDGADPDALQQLVSWAQAQGTNQMQLDNMQEIIDREGAFGFVGKNGGRVLYVPTNRPPDRMIFSTDQSKSNYFTFDHELGHLVSPHGTAKSGVSGDFAMAAAAAGGYMGNDMTEHVADSFATLRGVRRGTLDKEDIQHVASLRDGDFVLWGGIGHFTSMALDAIVINPKNTDFISMTPEETLSLANKHAKTFMHNANTDNTLFRIRNVGYIPRRDRGHVTPMTTDEKAVARLQALAKVCMDKPSSSPEFYLAARIVNNAINNGGVSYLDYKVDIDSKSPEWQKIHADILAKAGGRDIGGMKSMASPAFSKPEKKSFISQLKKNLTPIRI